MELDNLEAWLTDGYLSPEQAATTKSGLCKDLTKGEIPTERALLGLGVVRKMTVNCFGDGLKKRVESLGVYGKLYVHSAKGFCAEMKGLPRGGFFSDAAIEAADSFEKELFCAADELYRIDPPLFLFYLRDDFLDFPPYVQLLGAAESLCQQLEAGDLDSEQADRRLQRAYIEAYGDERAVGNALLLHLAQKNFGETLAVPAMVIAAVAAVVWVLSLVGWLLAKALVWLDPTRFLWDDLQEWSEMGLGASSIASACLMLIMYSDTFLKFLQGVAILAGIVGAVIGAFVKLKSLHNPKP